MERKHRRMWREFANISFFSLQSLLLVKLSCPGHCSFIPLIFYHMFCFLSIRLRVKFLSLLWTLLISCLPLLYEATVHPFNSLSYPKVLENYITQSQRSPACSSALSLSLSLYNEWMERVVRDSFSGKLTVKRDVKLVRGWPLKVDLCLESWRRSKDSTGVAVEQDRKWCRMRGK